MVACFEALHPQDPTRGVIADGISDQRLHIGRVDRDPFVDAINESTSYCLHVLRIAGRCVSIDPAVARHLQRIGQIPVIKRGSRTDPPRQKAIDQAIVEVETSWIQLTLTKRLHSRPTDRKPIRINPKGLQEVEVFVEMVIVVRADITSAAIDHRFVLVRKDIPDAGPLAIYCGSTLDLVGI